ncbi:MAG: hypothetical protein RLZZ165_590 [Bacteroidota bacterium]|jgi:hypothetical protein
MSCCSDLRKAVFPGADACCFSDGTVVEENKRKFTVRWERKGKRSICRIKVDGCLVTDPTQKKCDYVFLICPEQEFLFVELKGTDIKRGMEQLRATIEFFRSKSSTPIPQEKILGYVVSSAVPSSSNQEVRDAQIRFKQSTGRGLVVQNRQCEHVVK